jgi:outer membrane protein A (fragment)
MKTTARILPTALLLALFATNSNAQMPQLAEQWQTFGAPVPANESVTPGWAGAIFYRPAGAGGPAANIYVNGEYLASLLPGGYRYAELCPYNQRLASAYTGQDPAYNIKAGAGEFYDLPKGYVSFFRVIDGGMGPSLQAVNRATAGRDLGLLREQVHTLPRLEQNRSCSPELVQQYNIDVAALFKFDRYDYASMLPEGKQRLKEIAADSYQYRDATSVIYIDGYTDPEGRPAYNQRLSQRRAQTVKRVLVENGFNASSLKARGHGETDLVVSDCRARYPRNASARAACDQPNRRVEIKLYGKNMH